MKALVLLVLFFTLAACENHAFDRDKRQILAKNELRKLMHDNQGITITRFREDTLASWQNAVFSFPIRYTLDFQNNESDTSANHKCIVIFSPQGDAVVESYLSDH